MRIIKYKIWSEMYHKIFDVVAIMFLYNNGNVRVKVKDTPDDKEFDTVFDYLMQYTGFTDVNGKEIYEGSIIREGCNSLIGTVIWDDSIGTYKLKEYGDYYIKDASIEWEVIGNIYENPELLNN